MKTTLGLIGSAVSVAAMIAGCGSASGGQRAPTTSASTPPAHEHGGMAMTTEMCPMQVEGTTVAPAEVEGGVALAFTNASGDVAELRRRVRRMGAMHNEHHATGGMMMERHAGGGAGAEHDQHGAGGAAGHEGMAMGGGTMMPAATATVEDIEGGARVVLRPSDPAELGALRDHVQTHAGHMARGECPMMPPGGHAMPPPTAAGSGHMAHQPSAQQ